MRGGRGVSGRGRERGRDGAGREGKMKLKIHEIQQD